MSAKHLEPLKGGKIGLEILVRGKDQEQNAKQLEQCLDVIKSSGVRDSQVSFLPGLTPLRRKLACSPKTRPADLLQTNGPRRLATSQKM